MNIVAALDHRLARLESAARTFLRSDLHRREARAAVEREVFDGADKLADAEAEQEVWEPTSPPHEEAAVPIGEWRFTADEQQLLGLKPGDILGWGVVGEPIASAHSVFRSGGQTKQYGPRPRIAVARPHPRPPTNVPTDLAASGDSPAAECEPPSPAAGHSTPLPVLLSRASMVLGLYAPKAWQPLADELQDAAYAYLRHK